MSDAQVPRPELNKLEISGVNSEAVHLSLGELTKRNVEIVAELEKSADAERTATDRMADAISKFVGSMKFVYIHIAWFTLWIALFTLPFIPRSWQIDPFPYTFLTFVVSLEAIFLSIPRPGFSSSDIGGS